VHQAPVGCAVTPSRCTRRVPPSYDEHVQPAQQHRVHVEEVDRQQPLRPRAQEGSPTPGKATAPTRTRSSPTRGPDQLTRRATSFGTVPASISMRPCSASCSRGTVVGSR
jgi:hypothetical protein